MLGTNELKNEYKRTPEEIGRLLENYFVKTVLEYRSQIDGTHPDLLMISPPIVNEFTAYGKNNDKYLGAGKKSEELSEIYEKIAVKYGCLFLDAGGLKVGVDGVHLTKDSHLELAKMIENKLKEFYKNPGGI